MRQAIAFLLRLRETAWALPAAMLAVLLAAVPASGQVTLEKVKALRQAEKTNKVHLVIRYSFDGTGLEYLLPSEQAARRAAIAAKAWQLRDATKPVAVLARSPFGGGECAKSYWPDGVEPELLRKTSEALDKAKLKYDFPDLPPETTTAPALSAATKPTFFDIPTEVPAKPLLGPATRPAWPAAGFCEDYEFVIVVGLHHEPVPYQGVRRTEDGKPVYDQGSRVSAWAILFHCPTATAIWGTSCMARTGHHGVADPLALAAETVLGYLDFADVGAENITDHVARMAMCKDLPMVDLAAMLVQTQRADAVEAVVKLGLDNAAYKQTATVLRYFNERGEAQDFRIDHTAAGKANLVYASQRVAMRILLVEQLRGVRGLEACQAPAIVHRGEDLDMGSVGQHYAARLAPMTADDEIILIAELANDDEAGMFKANRLEAVKMLGKCKLHIELALAVARHYAQRQPPPPPGRRAAPDPLKDAAGAAIVELNKTRQEQKQKEALKAPP